MPELLLAPMPGNETMADKIAALIPGRVMQLDTRAFPDGETYLRYPDDISGRDLTLVCTLDHPDAKIVPLLFAARTARELGVRRIGLIAPYLCYMRQDKRFHPGEALTSRLFAGLIDEAFDWLVTLDPHLHRYKSLDRIYSIPARAVHAAPLLGQWIQQNVHDAFLIGPDAESEQWVSQVARVCGARYGVLSKERLGDRKVRIAPPHLGSAGDATPVLLDDIISSGRTMQEALKLIAPLFRKPPVIVAVHGIFAEGIDAALRSAGARLATTNSIPNASNEIDIAPLLAAAAREMVAAGGS
jgi:ribose-phosphate pyrophosphokinase